MPVMARETVDEASHIQALWAAFEDLVGLAGRKMYALVDTTRGTYTTCTPPRDGDDADLLGLAVGVLPGGRYLRGRLAGQPPEVYVRIAPGMAELEAAGRRDATRPLIEFYRRHDAIDLWLPIEA